MIDILKPLELVDGTPVTMRGLRTHGSGIIIDLPDGASRRLGVLGEDCGRSYNLDGHHVYKALPNLRNVRSQAPAFDPTKPVQTRNGLKARIICTDQAGSRRPVVALVSHTNGEEDIVSYTSNGSRWVNGDTASVDLINVPVVTTEYRSFNDTPLDNALGLPCLAPDQCVSRDYTIKLTRTAGKITAIELLA